VFVTYFHFCYVYTGGARRGPLVAAYGFLAVAAAAVLPTNLVIQRMVVAPYGYAPVVSRFGIPIFLASWILIGAGIVLALRARRRTPAGEDRQRYLYLAVAGLFPLIGAGLDGFSDLPPMAIWTNLAFSVICTVAVLKHRLLDTRVLARKAAGRVLVGTVVAIPYVGSLALLNLVVREPVAWWAYAVGVLLFAVLLRPLYGSVQELVERLFYRERYDHLLALRDFSREVVGAAGLGEAKARLTELTRGALRASTALLLQPDDGGTALVALSGGQELRLACDGSIVRWLRKHRAILSSSALAADPELQAPADADREALNRMDARLLAPVFAKQGDLVGVMALGPKTTGTAYTTEDLHLLESVGTQAAMALENSRIYASLEKARQDLEAWLQNLPDAVVTVDGNNVVRFANRAAVQRLGVRPGHHWLLRRREMDRPVQETILGREYEIASAPLLDPGGVTEVICVLRDITERKQQDLARVEWERRARITSHLASIGEMAAGIAHEINNPLTAVIGYSSLLDGMGLEGDVREAVTQIQDGALRVAAITQRLLTFARQRKPERRAVDLNEVVRSTVELRSYSLRTSNVTVKLDLDHALPETVADAQQMQQVLLNLIINAESAMRSAHGGGVLAVRTGRSGDRLQIRVIDNGPGVPEELRERVFDPFFTTKGEGEGSGLGLSICHGIISEHNGSITIRDAPGGQGAEFCVEIPAAIPPARQAAPQASAGSAADAGRTRGRILVVDDEPSVRRLLDRILSAEGHQVECVADGGVGLERILRGSHDVVLLDIRMPGMNGIAVHRQVSREQPSLARRIVLMTGDVMATETREFVERTGVRCITKPFDLPAVSGIVRELLGERSERQGG
jgi:signal transduction histidine kinase/CheY-like chemotaxis protein